MYIALGRRIPSPGTGDPHRGEGWHPDATEPLYLDNTGHPAADRFALARALKSHVDALGMKWSDTSAKNNGQFAPFKWRSA